MRMVGFSRLGQRRSMVAKTAFSSGLLLRSMSGGPRLRGMRPLQ
jgi:hypothetical protein